MVRGCVALGLLWVVVATGCATPSYEPWRSWSRTHGGVSDDVALAGRATAALARIEGAAGIATLRVRVLDCDVASAWAFDDGALFVSRGLLSMMDDDEVAAALAHEVGHLVARIHEPAQARSEALADEFGLRLLRATIVPEHAMATMLEKLAALEGANPQLRDRLLRLRTETEQVAMLDGSREGPPTR